MLAFSALVAGSFALGVLAANEIAPSAINAVRFWLAALALGLFCVATGRLRRDLTAGAATAPWRYLVLGGLFGSYFWLMFEGLKTAPAVSAAAVFTLTPVLTAFFGYLVLRQRLTPRVALGLAIGACGALWVIFRGDWTLFRAFDVGRGEVIYFLGCVAHALYTPMVRKLNRGESVLIFTLGTLIAGAVFLSLAGGRALWETDWSALPGIVWVTLIYVTIFATLASFLLLQFAVLRLPAAKVMAYTYLTPSWVILWQIALGHGAPPAFVLIGVALTCGALLLLLARDDQGAA